jgi:DNA-binding CsgD family transcriptional regulator
MGDDALEEALAALEHLRRRVDVFARIHDALARLREVGSVAGMIERAPAAVAAACGFDRVALYRIDESNRLLAEAFHVAGDPEAARELLAFSREHPAPLGEQILETEMIRRRKPMVVRDALHHPLTYKPLVEHYDTPAYVAAPIMPEGRVIGFLHAEHGLERPGDPDGVDELDRDALWAFAEGFGYAVERMQLLERLRAQGEEVRRLIARTETVVTEYLDAEVRLAAAPHDGAAATRTAAALFAEPETGPAVLLTRREREVLALIADGATNAQIADHLVIAEGTAKSHVKRILRKLGAGNRVEAAAMFLRARVPGDGT